MKKIMGEVPCVKLVIGPESKESTRPLVFTITKWARTSDFSDMVVRQDVQKYWTSDNQIRKILNFFTER